MFETFGLEHPLSLLGGGLRFALRIWFLIAWVFAFGALVYVLRACFACCFSRRFLHLDLLGRASHAGSLQGFYIRICLGVLRTLVSTLISVN